MGRHRRFADGFSAHNVTLLCQRTLGRVLDKSLGFLGCTLEPGTPYSTNNEPLESSHCLAPSLALRDSSGEILACRFEVVRLGEGDAVKDRVEAPVAKPVEAMANTPSG